MITPITPMMPAAPRFGAQVTYNHAKVQNDPQIRLIQILMRQRDFMNRASSLPHNILEIRFVRETSTDELECHIIGKTPKSYKDARLRSYTPPEQISRKNIPASANNLREMGKVLTGLFQSAQTASKQMSAVFVY